MPTMLVPLKKKAEAIGYIRTLLRDKKNLSSCFPTNMTRKFTKLKLLNVKPLRLDGIEAIHPVPNQKAKDPYRTYQFREQKGS